MDVGFWNSILIPIMLGILGPTVGVVPLHSACVASRGRGLLIAGLSGAGKSTLAFAMAKQGFLLVSDDWTYAAQNTGGVEAHGLRVPVKLMPDSEIYFQELRHEQLQVSLNGELAFEINPWQVAGIETCDKCDPKCIVFLERTIDETSIRPLKKSVAQSFFERSLEPLPVEFAEAAEGRSRIMRSVAAQDCWLFRYSGKPDIGANFLRDFFKERYDAD